VALPAHYREVVVLCDLEELNYDVAAAMLECPVGTVRSRLNRARGLLRERLAVFREGGAR
jgi:RNA polymerase sigma-70 factor (ECF subfamily)